MSIKSAVCYILIFILILSVFTLSAFADDVTPSESSTFYTIPYSGATPSGDDLVVQVTGTDSSHPVYLSFYYITQGDIGLIFLSDYYYVNLQFTLRFGNITKNFLYTLDQSSLYDDVYYNYTTSNFYLVLNQVPYDVYVYSSIDDAISAFSSIISGGDSSSSSFQYSLPPGNVAYIPIPRGISESITFTLTTTYYMAFGNNDTSRINQVVTVLSSLPSSSSNLAPSSPIIPWTNNGNLNLLGISANKIYNGSIPSNYGGQYLVVVNPMTMPSQGGLIGGDTYTNGSINITVSASGGSPHIYPMSESLTITPGDGIGSESSYGDSGYTFEVDPETGEIIWTDPNGGNEAPVAGGNNPMPSPNTIFDWLRNISQQLSDFLRGPVQAVQVVVSAIRDFMGSFTQLYQWLPSPVYSLITSALMIALTIGVIKIFV